MSLQAKLRSLADLHGADFFGMADLSPLRHEVLRQGGEEIAAYPRAVSIGIVLPHAIVNQLPRREEHAVRVAYRHHAYDVVNQRLDLLISSLAGLLQREGYPSYPVPAAKRIDDERICAVFSHKLAASQAGLGWIGRSCLLVTPAAGPRVRWATVLTAAPLPSTGASMRESCGDCRACVEICPVGAFTGEPFRPGEPREVRYDARRCEQYHDELEARYGQGVCGMCLYVCPHGRTGDQGSQPQITSI